MRARPFWVFLAIATLMVVWLSVRMWCGDLASVWSLSCLLGAWAPLATAVIYTYIREAGRREHGVLAAWLVRAIGMHCVLVWLLGINDFLRGPPGLAPQWNTDVGMPVVLLAFAPVFAVSVSIVRWIQRVARRTDPRPVPALRASPGSVGAVPYRGHAMVASTVATAGWSWTPLVVGAWGTYAARATSLPAPWVLCGSAAAMALVTVPRSRATVPSIVSLCVVAGMVVARFPTHTVSEAVSVGMLWPCLGVIASVVYLTLVEAGLWLRAVAVRA